MPILLQIDFPFQGPWGAEMSSTLQGLAESIAQEPGLLWKIWTENPETGEAGGIYLFTDRRSAEAYLAMHTERLVGLDDTTMRHPLSNMPARRFARRQTTVTSSPTRISPPSRTRRQCPP